MPTVAYAPPPIRRYFALDNDPDSTVGGASLDTINGNTAMGITADATGFPAAPAIPDVTKEWMVSSAHLAWTPTRISLDNLVTGLRVSKPEIPLKVSPVLTFTAASYRYMVEKALLLAMGKVADTGAGPTYTHTITGLPFGATLQPSAIVQLIRDAINQKMTGVAFESVQVTFSSDGAGSLEVEAHPLYAQLQDDSGSPVMPSGTIAESTKQPMLLRDLQVTFDSGATAEFGVSEFTFGWRNNSNYERHIAGACIESKTLNAAAYKLWYPAYHKLSGRPTITYALTFVDAKIAQELALQWAQIRKIAAVVKDAQGGTDQITFTLYAAAHDDGGVAALAATGDLNAQFSGRSFYSVADTKDVEVAVTNSNATIA